MPIADVSAPKHTLADKKELLSKVAIAIAKINTTNSADTPNKERVIANGPGTFAGEHAPLHIVTVTHCLDEFDTHLHKLQLIDRLIALSACISLLALALSPVISLLTPLLAMPAIAYAGYLYGKREQAASLYRRSLDYLTDCYTWCFLDKSAQIDYVDQHSSPLTPDEINSAGGIDGVKSRLHPVVLRLLTTVSPLLSDQALLLHSRPEAGFNQLLSRDKQASAQSDIDNGKTTKFELSMHYLLYGKSETRARDVAAALGRLISHCLKRCYSAVKSCISSQAEEEAVNAHEMRPN